MDLSVRLSRQERVVEAGDPSSRLRHALEADELVLLYQPIKALKDGTYPMAEIFVRLRAEEEALIPPGEFLPVFEHYHMMPELDRWVVQRTVRSLLVGSAAPRFSVNVSGQTLDDAEFARFVGAALAVTRVPPNALLFEIDEADALEHADAAGRFAAQMKGVGCQVVIDAFARDAISFAPVKLLRPDFVKIDGSMTRRLLSSESSVRQLKIVVEVCRTLGIGVIASCVETQDVLARMKALGVEFAQGFGIQKPSPMERSERVGLGTR